MSDTTPSVTSSKRRLSTESSTQRSTKQKTFDLSHLDPSEDRLTSDDHEHLDKAAHSSIDRVLSFTGQPAPSVIDILRKVVTTCDGLDQAYRDADRCEALLGDETYGPQLREMLELAWSEKSFKSIRNLKYLQKEIPINKPESPLFSADDEASYKRAVESSWTCPYEGKAHALLFRTISDMNVTREERMFSNYLPIVQSSGTGKSRTVHEMSRLVFTVPFNVRADVEGAGLAFPNPDVDVADYLKIGGTKQITYNEAKQRYLRFFTSLFSVAIVKLAEMKTLNLKTHRDLAQQWSAWFDDPDWRRTFFRAVVEKDEEERRKDDPTADIDRLLKKTSKKATGEFKKLTQAQDSIVKEDLDPKAVRLVLYFDEAHNLHDTKVKPERTLYEALCSAANDLVKQPLFVVFLSTVSKLSAFAPAASVHTSSRKLAGDKSGLQAPFTELPFDIRAMNEPPIKPNHYKLEDINAVEFMCQFGRPLWKSLLKSFTATNDTNFDSIIIRLAQGKLACQLPEAKLSDDAVLAALAVRLCLDFKPTADGATKEAQLVASHMRIAFSVPAHRLYMKSGYPSEPVLAEAAARLMHNAFNKKRRPVETLLSLLDQDVIDKGERGEMVARLILTQAYDKAVLAETRLMIESAPKFYSGVRLESFIRALFGDEKAEMILESKPDNVPGGVTFREAFKTAIVRFTHFQRAGDDTAASTDAALAAFIRGMAFQCFTNQKEIDVLVPILLRDEKLGEWVMTAILIQIKDRAARVPKAQLRIDEKKVGFFPTNEDDECKRRPYIALHMELGVRPPARSTSSHDEPEDSKDPGSSSRVGTSEATMPSTPPKVGKGKAAKVLPDTPSKFEISQPGRNKYSTATHPRYSIFVAGCSGSVYPVVDDKRAYLNLLNSQTVLQDHPRQSEEALSAVRRLKPSWVRGKDCYDWIDLPSLSGQGGVREELEETLTTGDQIADDDNDDDMFAD